ncbi:MAG: hypothetical protein [Circular genetic element sp.]|nr:MAG: hypothetical protein [Circular genetic element sp.]
MYKKVYKRKPSRLGKRDWTVSASAFGAKGSFSYRSKRSLSSTVTDIVRRNLETPQHHVISDSAQSAMTQNTFYSFNLLSGLAKGDSNFQRNGDTIHIDAIKLNLFTQNYASAPNNPAYIRYMIVKENGRVLPGGTTWGSGLGSPDLFINLPVGLPALSGIFDPKKTTVLMDTLVKIVPQYPGQVSAQTTATTIKVDQKFVYETDTVWGKNINYYLVAVPYIPGGTTGVTSVNDTRLSFDIIFKNSK